MIMIIFTVASPSEPLIEKKSYIQETFESDWCTSPLTTSLAPYWELDGAPLNNNDNNTRLYGGAFVNRTSTKEGRHTSKVTISLVKSDINGSIIACLVNKEVTLKYLIIIGNLS